MYKKINLNDGRSHLKVDFEGSRDASSNFEDHVGTGSYLTVGVADHLTQQGAVWRDHPCWKTGR